MPANDKAIVPFIRLEFNVMKCPQNYFVSVATQVITVKRSRTLIGFFFPPFWNKFLKQFLKKKRFSILNTFSMWEKCKAEPSDQSELRIHQRCDKKKKNPLK